MITMIQQVILTLNLIMVCIKADEMCKFLKPNDNFEGIRLYRKYYDNKSVIEKYFMINSIGSMWELSLDYDHHNNLMVSTSSKESDQLIDATITHLFSLKYHKATENVNLVFDCSVKLNVTCLTNDNFELKYPNVEIPLGALVFIPKSNQSLDYVIIWDKKNNSSSIFNLTDHWNRNEPINSKSCDRVTVDLCPVPLFIRQMSEDLRPRVSAILDFNKDSRSFGHLVFFNIDGKPQYCLQPQDKNITDVCKSIANLKPFMSECFELQSHRMSVWEAGILLIVLLVIIMFGSVAFYHFCYLKVNDNIEYSPNLSMKTQSVHVSQMSTSTTISDELNSKNGMESGVRVSQPFDTDKCSNIDRKKDNKK